jgi:hypothetical protein
MFILMLVNALHALAVDANGIAQRKVLHNKKSAGCHARNRSSAGISGDRHSLPLAISSNNRRSARSIASAVQFRSPGSTEIAVMP